MIEIDALHHPVRMPRFPPESGDLPPDPAVQKRFVQVGNRLAFNDAAPDCVVTDRECDEVDRGPSPAGSAGSPDRRSRTSTDIVTVSTTTNRDDERVTEMCRLRDETVPHHDEAPNVISSAVQARRD